MASQTQIDGVPADAVISLEPLPEKLKRAVNFTAWSIYVKKTLKMEDLDSLIDSTVDRAEANHPKYALWRKISLKNWNVAHQTA